LVVLKRDYMKKMLITSVIVVLLLTLLVTLCGHKSSKSTKFSSTVYLTTYTIDPRQTDNTPLITASGFKLHPRNPRKHRIIAVSRDLKRRFKYGQRVKIQGAGKMDGVYVIHDIMNKRFSKRIDILINPKDKPTSYKNVKLVAI